MIDLQSLIRQVKLLISCKISSCAEERTLAVQSNLASTDIKKGTVAFVVHWAKPTRNDQVWQFTSSRPQHVYRYTVEPPITTTSPQRPPLFNGHFFGRTVHTLTLVLPSLQRPPLYNGHFLLSPRWPLKKVHWLYSPVHSYPDIFESTNVSLRIQYFPCPWTICGRNCESSRWTWKCKVSAWNWGRG